ncbi:hypothetical protein HV310_07205 [Citrobacter freundii]|nr:ead/Ea22-like family protein [Citrobacter freundii]QMR44529.1 hypothetical protein HV310_07205 [Citrobacter freundii]
MTALNKQALREAAQEEIMLRSVSDTSDAWQDEVSPEAVLALLDELEAAEKRIAELTGKPAEEYADDGELLFEIDFCDDLSTSIQTAQWLKELRIRRTAGIGVKGD